MTKYKNNSVTGDWRADLGLNFLTGGVSRLFNSTEEQRMTRRKNKGKVQGNDQLGINPMDSPSWIQNMMSTGRDENGNISSKSAKRGGGFTNKEIAASMAEFQQLQEQRAYEEAQWEKRESLQGQVAQAKEAGLNPALMYGSGASAGSGQIASSDMDVDGSSQYDEFGGAFDVLSQVFGLVNAGQGVADSVSGLKTQATQRKNDTARTEAEVANTNADTSLKQSQTENQNNINANFWRKADDEHVNMMIDSALKHSGIAKNEEEMKLIEKQASAIEIQLKQREQELAIAAYNAQSERMQVVANTKKVAQEIELMQQQMLESASRAYASDRSAALSDKQIEEIDARIKNIGVDIESKEWEVYLNECSKSFGLPREYVPYAIGLQAQMSPRKFAKWLAGFQKAATNKATAISYIESTGNQWFTSSSGSINNTASNPYGRQ